MVAITICGEGYSPNLGDGVIADCLKYLIERVAHDAEVKILDMSRRTEYEPRTVTAPPFRGRRQAIRQRVVKSIPRVVRQAIRQVEWRKNYDPPLRQHVTDALAGTDVLIVGGGQLLMDNGLRFPMKIRTTVSAARAVGVKKIAYFACGVGGVWSPRGRKIMTESLQGDDVARIVTRDLQSMSNLKKNFPGLSTPASVAGDPAVWAREAYGISRDHESQPEDAGKPIGLGVMGTRLLGPYVKDDSIVSSVRIMDFWTGLVRRLRANGDQCALFTNGDTVDFAFAKVVAEAVVADDPDGGPVELLPCARTPGELVEQIAGFRAVAAYRLHANILAYALGVPVVGLVWDPKVRQFGEQTERTRFTVEAEDLSPEIVERLLAEAQSEGLDPDRCNAVRAVVEDALRDVLCSLGVSCPQIRQPTQVG